jgi:hypothetical protein
MSNEPKHPISPADATRLAGEAFRTQIAPSRTRPAGTGYQSILATRLAAQPVVVPTERYKMGDRIGGALRGAGHPPRLNGGRILTGSGCGF